MNGKQDINSLVRKLSNTKAPVCMSIYTPLDYDSPDAINANKIRIKNIISEVRHLQEHSKDFDIKNLNKQLKPLEELMNNPEKLWQRSAKSLAVFACRDFLVYHFLPIERTDRQVVVSNSFLVEPLRQIIKENKSFYILSASHNGVELFYGDKFHLEPVDLEALPKKGAEETIGIDEYPNSLQYHPATTPASKAGRGKYNKQFHDQYNAVEVDRNILKKYFRAVNSAVANYLRRTKQPLIFAGVDYLFPLYEQVNSYQHLIKRPVEGNFQHKNLKELHERALALV